MDYIETIREYYDKDVSEEWGRLERHKIEFEMTKRYLKRYIKPGDRVLDLGGGPGRYSLFLAETGCDVTLADLSQGNIDFALQKAAERSLCLSVVQADARRLDCFGNECFDHVLCMGPLYHIKEQSGRDAAVSECLRMLKPGGTLSAAFISSYAAMIYAMKYEPALIGSPGEDLYYDIVAKDRDYAGVSFTESYFIRHVDVLPFFERFPLEKLNFLSTEGMLAPCEPNILAQPPEIVSKWIDLAEKICEREDILPFAEHFLYVGRKAR